MIKPRLIIPCFKKEESGNITHPSLMYSTSIGDVVLNPKVPIGTTRIVAGCQNDSSDGFYFADYAGHCRRRHDPILTDNQSAKLEQEGERNQE